MALLEICLLQHGMCTNGAAKRAQTELNYAQPKKGA